MNTFPRTNLSPLCDSGGSLIGVTLFKYSAFTNVTHVGPKEFACAFISLCASSDMMVACHPWFTRYKQ